MVRAKHKDWAAVAGQLHLTVSSLSTAARKAEEVSDLAMAGGARSRHQTSEKKIEDLGISATHSNRPGG